MIFSVIMPIYNSKNYVNKAIESVLIQDFNDYELILVDDGSTDGSAIIADKYAKQFLQIRVIHQKNMGPSAARNAGIYAANGEYLLFLDSDDLYEPHFFKSLAQEIGKTRSAVYCFGYQEYHYINNKLKPCMKKLFVPDEYKHYENQIELRNNIYNILLNRLLFNSMCNKAYRKADIWKNQLFLREDIYIGEDFCFNLSVLGIALSYTFLPWSFYNYIFQNENSLITKFKTNKFEQMIIISNEKFNFIQAFTAENEKKNVAIFKIDYIRSFFSCCMDLHKTNCPISQTEKINFIKKMRHVKQLTFSLGDFTYLSIKEKFVYIIYFLPFIWIQYKISGFFYWLKFKCGVNF